MDRKELLTRIIRLVFDVDGVDAAQVTTDDGHGNSVRHDAWEWSFLVKGIPCFIQFTGQVLHSDDGTFFDYLAQEIADVRVDLGQVTT